ncbi:MarR family winged helix-turn-helix transcriptional regulator [Anthocerotibacter panamensis]|uniref:MarR family winged helix-turn-helix transcriptional regulator n=1 Tax=Anthocerotibacter panamensis TaxID=2857077 RepID=UPI001C405C25|nr:MarR family transcriptional regulator [Anthocerotibacter panamensis]
MTHPTLELKKAYLALRRALDHTVRPFHLTGAQFDVLQLLMHSDGLEHSELQRQLAIASPTLTNIIDVLEREGHVERRADGADARKKTIHMSNQARLLCSSDAFCDAGEALVQQMFRGFSEQDSKSFMQTLKRIERNLEDVAS